MASIDLFVEKAKVSRKSLSKFADVSFHLKTSSRLIKFWLFFAEKFKRSAKDIITGISIITNTYK